MTEEEEKHLLVFDLFNLDKVLWLKNTMKHYNIHPHDIRYDEIIDTSNFLHDKDFIEFLTVHPDNGIKLNSAGERYFEGLKKKKAKEELESKQIHSNLLTQLLQRYALIFTLILTTISVCISYNTYVRQRETDEALILKDSSIKHIQYKIQEVKSSLDSMRVLLDTNNVSKNQKN